MTKYQNLNKMVEELKEYKLTYSNLIQKSVLLHVRSLLLVDYNQ